MAPASSIDPPDVSIAASVSAVSATTLLVPAAAADAVELAEEGAEMTNHFTEPPRRAASMEATSPIPPGGEITTTSAEDDDDGDGEDDASRAEDDDLTRVAIVGEVNDECDVNALVDVATNSNAATRVDCRRRCCCIVLIFCSFLLFNADDDLSLSWCWCGGWWWSVVGGVLEICPDLKDLKDPSL